MCRCRPFQPSKLANVSLKTDGTNLGPVSVLPSTPPLSTTCYRSLSARRQIFLTFYYCVIPHRKRRILYFFSISLTKFLGPYHVVNCLGQASFLVRSPLLLEQFEYLEDLRWRTLPTCL